MELFCESLQRTINATLFYIPQKTYLLQKRCDNLLTTQATTKGNVWIRNRNQILSMASNMDCSMEGISITQSLHLLCLLFLNDPYSQKLWCRLKNYPGTWYISLWEPFSIMSLSCSCNAIRKFCTSLLFIMPNEGVKLEKRDDLQKPIETA